MKKTGPLWAGFFMGSIVRTIAMKDSLMQATTLSALERLLSQPRLPVASESHKTRLSSCHKNQPFVFTFLSAFLP